MDPKKALTVGEMSRVKRSDLRSPGALRPLRLDVHTQLAGYALASRQMSPEQAAREEEHRARLRENAGLVRKILPYKPHMVLYPGNTHAAMGNRLAILENLEPLADVAHMANGPVFVGVPGGNMKVLGNFSSALSSRVAQKLERHNFTMPLRREGKPMIGCLAHEFEDSDPNVLVYINGEAVREPGRVIIEERAQRQPIVFEPSVDGNRTPKQDAFVIRVARPSGEAPAFFSIEGWGPAGTLQGLRMFHEDRRILSELAKRKLESFEAVIVVNGVRVEKIEGEWTMTAAGPLDLAKIGPIDISLDEQREILTAAATLSDESPVLLSADQIYNRTLLLRGLVLQ